MTRPTRLALVTLPIIHHCPYKQRDAHLARCYIDSNDVYAAECYNCDHVVKLKEQYGLRTFKRRLVINRCAHCQETVEAHEGLPPYIGSRVPCPGFDDSKPDVPLHVPLNEACTDWMIVMSSSGHRMTLAEYREQRLAKRDPGLRGVVGETPATLARLRLPLVGAPLTPQAYEAAQKAERERIGYNTKPTSNDEAATNPEKPAPRKRKAGGSRRSRTK